MANKDLICAPVSHAGYVVPGSIPGNCSQCQQLVWIAPSSLLILHDNPGTDILCTECASKQTGSELEIEELTPAQLDEIEQFERKRGS